MSSNTQFIVLFTHYLATDDSTEYYSWDPIPEAPRVFASQKEADAYLCEELVKELVRRVDRRHLKDTEGLDLTVWEQDEDGTFTGHLQNKYLYNRYVVEREMNGLLDASEYGQDLGWSDHEMESQKNVRYRVELTTAITRPLGKKTETVTVATVPSKSAGESLVFQQANEVTSVNEFEDGEVFTGSGDCTYVFTWTMKRFVPEPAKRSRSGIEAEERAAKRTKGEKESEDE